MQLKKGFQPIGVVKKVVFISKWLGCSKIDRPPWIVHRGLKLDGAIGQGEICNSLKSENFSKSFLSHIGKNKIKFYKKQFFGYHEALKIYGAPKLCSVM